MKPETDRDRLAVLVHEVRSPVAALTAIAEALRGGDLDEATRHELPRLAIAAARGIERVVRDATVGSIRLEHVDVGRLVRETVGATRLGGAHVRVSILGDVPDVDADPLRLRQALDNLVSNAVAHSPPGTEVVVSVEQGKEDVQISVSDTGKGIPIDEQERIFEPGVRLADGHPGSGLGLALVRVIAEAHHGTVTVRSAPGTGSTFTLALPKRQPATKASSS